MTSSSSSSSSSASSSSESFSSTPSKLESLNKKDRVEQEQEQEQEQGKEKEKEKEEEKKLEPSSSSSSSYGKKFWCDYCSCHHMESDIFLWSICQHKMSRECARALISRQIDEQQFPTCVINNCHNMLQENEACLILNEEELASLVSISLQMMMMGNNNNNNNNNNNYNIISNTWKEEKEEMFMPTGRLRHNTNNSNPAENGEEDIKTNSIIDNSIDSKSSNKSLPSQSQTQMQSQSQFHHEKYRENNKIDNEKEEKKEEILASADFIPLQDLSLFKSKKPNSSENKNYIHDINNTDSSLMDETACTDESSFECMECHNFEHIKNIFYWTKCRHQYSKECAVYVVIQHLTMQLLPYCIVNGCEQLLFRSEASSLLPSSVYNIYNNVYTNLGMTSFEDSFYTPENNNNNNNNNNNDNNSFQSASNNNHNNRHEKKKEEEGEKKEEKEEEKKKEDIGKDTSTDTSNINKDTDHHPPHQQTSHQKNNNCPLCSNDTTNKKKDNESNESIRLNGCKHEFCKNCIRKAIIEQIEVLNIFPPNCPSCHVNLETQETSELIPEFIKQQEDIQAAVDPLAGLPITSSSTDMFTGGVDTYEKPMKFLPTGPGRRSKPPPPKDYIMRLTAEDDLKEPSKNILKNSGVMFCPTPACGVEVANINNPRFVCSRCGVVWCLRCKTEWHKGITCEEYEQQSVRMAQDEMALAELEKNSGLGYHAFAASGGLQLDEARQILLMQQNEMMETKENISENNIGAMVQMMNEQLELDELNRMIGMTNDIGNNNNNNNNNNDDDEKYGSEEKRRKKKEPETIRCQKCNQVIEARMRYNCPICCYQPSQTHPSNPIGQEEKKIAE